MTSPNHLHVPQARAILEAGKHVVCEKPLALTAAESAALVAGRRAPASSTRSTSTSGSTRSTSTFATSSPTAAWATSDS